MADYPPMELLLTAPEVQRQLAQRIRALRLQAGWKQSTLAERSGVSLTTLQRFERNGLTSTANFLRLVWALGRLHEFAALLQPPAATSMAALEAQQAPQRSHQRGRR